MAVQAWRGVPSHYNFTTPFDAALMRSGAAGTAGVFLVGVVVLLVAAARSRGTPAPVRLGVLSGGAVLLVGCLVGLVMVFNNSGVYQGSVGAGFGERATGYLGPDAATIGPEYLLLRPATDGGDLVLLHAIGVHGLLLLAVPAVLLARTTARRQLAVVALAAGSVTVAMAVLVAHALRQQPLGALGTVALTALALCALTLATTYMITVRAAIDRRKR
jgi:hypothetical protein